MWSSSRGITVTPVSKSGVRIGSLVDRNLPGFTKHNAALRREVIRSGSRSVDRRCNAAGPYSQPRFGGHDENPVCSRSRHRRLGGTHQRARCGTGAHSRAAAAAPCVQPQPLAVGTDKQPVSRANARGLCYRPDGRAAPIAATKTHRASAGRSRRSAASSTATLPGRGVAKPVRRVNGTKRTCTRLPRNAG